VDDEVQFVGASPRTPRTRAAAAKEAATATAQREAAAPKEEALAGAKRYYLSHSFSI